MGTTGRDATGQLVVGFTTQGNFDGFDDVRFRGGYAGGYGGQVGSVYNSESCQPLHWHTNLVKTS